jgi:serine/threonine-protein kinase
MEWSQMIGWSKRFWQEHNFKPEQVIRSRYQIIKGLGTGSYGVTYLCMDLKTNSHCVLKRSAPIRGGQIKAQQLYHREIEALDRLRHPCIPRLIEAFPYHRQLCFTMEYIEGESLEELVFENNHVFTESEALSAIKKLAVLLQYVHEQGIVHRDISMANVMMHHSELKLIDWGLARTIAVDGSIDTEADDIHSGDPEVKKRRRRLHVSSDFYALGHLLLFLLYSAYPETEDANSEQSWEQELDLQPVTKKLLRRLLMAEQPYSNAESIIKDLSNC